MGTERQKPSLHPHNNLHADITNPYSSSSPSSSCPSSISSRSSINTDNNNNNNTSIHPPNSATSICCMTNVSPTKMECILASLHIPSLAVLTYITTTFFSNNSSPNIWNFDVLSLQNGSTINSYSNDLKSGYAVGRVWKAILLSITIWMYCYVCLKSGDKMEGAWLHEKKRRWNLLRADKSKRVVEEEKDGQKEEIRTGNTGGGKVKHSNQSNLFHEEEDTHQEVNDDTNKKDEEEGDDLYFENEQEPTNTNIDDNPLPTTINKTKYVISPILYYTLFYLSLALSGSISSLYIFTNCTNTFTSSTSSSTDKISCHGNTTKMRLQALSMYILVVLPIFALSIYFLLPTTDKRRFLTTFHESSGFRNNNNIGHRGRGNNNNINNVSAIQSPSGASLYASVDFGLTCILLILNPKHVREGKGLWWSSFILSSMWIWCCFDLHLWTRAVSVRKMERQMRSRMEKRNGKRRRKGGGRKDEPFTLLLINADNDDNFLENDEKEEEEEITEVIHIAGTRITNDDMSTTATTTPTALSWSLSLSSVNFFFTLLDIAFDGGRAILGSSTISTTDNDLSTAIYSFSPHSNIMMITIVTFVLYSSLLWVGIITSTSTPTTLGLAGVCMVVVRTIYCVCYGGTAAAPANTGTATMLFFCIILLAFVECVCATCYSERLEAHLANKLQHWSLSRKIWDKNVLKFFKIRKKWSQLNEEEHENVELRLGMGGSGVAGTATDGRENWWKRRPSSMDLMRYLISGDEEEEYSDNLSIGENGLILEEIGEEYDADKKDMRDVERGDRTTGGGLGIATEATLV
mmetsp:Transcript_16788/g.22248  ORF Transcript_16788/g.22248 Transcript_16788/m.22248 type:complete len:804 (+) Transcript_16788:314-2725(+)